MRRATAIVLTAVLGSCAGAPTVPDDWYVAAGARDAAPFATMDAFEGARAILDGIDPGQSADRLERGDRALYGLTFDDGTGEPERWLMLVEVVEPIVERDGEPLIRINGMSLSVSGGERQTVSSVSEIAKLRLTRLALDGTEKGRSELDLPREPLTFGLARACAIYDAPGAAQHLSKDDVRILGMTILSAEALFDIVQRDELLADLMWQAARSPSLWSIVSSGFRVDVGLSIALDNSVRVGEVGTRGDPIYRFPIEIRANDEPALLVLADVTEPRSPWNVAAGVVGLTVRRPGDDDARLTVRLLAARRGTDD